MKLQGATNQSPGKRRGDRVLKGVGRKTKPPQFCFCARSESMRKCSAAQIHRDFRKGTKIVVLDVVAGIML